VCEGSLLGWTFFDLRFCTSISQNVLRRAPEISVASYESRWSNSARTITPPRLTPLAFHDLIGVVNSPLRWVTVRLPLFINLITSPMKSGLHPLLARPLMKTPVYLKNGGAPVWMNHRSDRGQSDRCTHLCWKSTFPWNLDIIGQ
jgi:hypothetical protein